MYATSYPGLPTVNRSYGRRTSSELKLETSPQRPVTRRQLSRWAITLEAPYSWIVRVHLHLLIAALPVLAISADVFGWVTLQVVAVGVLLPLIAVTTVVVTRRPDRSDRLILAGFLWGMVACAGYDAFRLPTIYAAHWWHDFFGTVGGWATGSQSNFLVGYLWRYVGDGGGIAVSFFVLAATLGAAAWPRRHVYALAIGYAVFPVWSGLVLTDLLAPHGRQLFPLTPTTLALSLAGHLIYGAILGLGYCLSGSQEATWPLHMASVAPLVRRWSAVRRARLAGPVPTTA
jgi:hypothetical protein